MRRFWTTGEGGEEETLVRMIKEGKNWVEIGLALNRSPDSCSGKATMMKVRGLNKKVRNFDKGVSAGTKTLSGRTIAKPKSDKSTLRPCMCCGVIFKSWDRTKNQRCSRCNQMQDPGPYAL